MKLYGLIVSTTLATAALILLGQEAAPPSVDLYEGQEEPEPTITPSAAVPNGPELPELKKLDQTFKQPTLGTDAEAIKMRVEWRELRNRTVNDPEVQAAKAFAQAAPTDLEKRNRLREYYSVYYQRMSALTTSPQIKLALEVFKVEHQNLLNQPRVRPSPTPEGATPTPTPTGTPPPKKPAHKHKRKVHL